MTPNQALKKPGAAAKKNVRRTKDADATRENIVAEALQEFSQHGLSGARVDRIADKTRTSKRMMYYYFESKEGLYREVLKESYRQLRELESNFHLEDLPPMLALRKLVEGTVDYHASHADFIRVIMNENILKGFHIRQLPELKVVNRKAIEIIEDICRRGTEEGIFRADLEPVKLHENISALAFFNVSNQHTFGFLFDQDFTDPRTHELRRAQIVDTITRYVRAP
ncbi:MAG: TetR/AcrR family transcriptional regulator [Gammaproteobacteria bacterium]|nr:TetR/AcrR family transcriptional regulator [Gammaproteobacteria bacterium]MDH5302872.1 TetR/AcrR family transcriptional regulator [Gammaproteobacteria bacterium]MDH5320977.1 TetR/AcrR family transcriptional regulator [Gammaproteobacteria bacterium]